MATQWLAVNDLDRAEAWVEALEKRYPDHNDTLFIRVKIASRRGDIAGAAEIGRAIKTSSFGILQRGVVVLNLCLILDDTVCAEEEFGRILALRFPDNIAFSAVPSANRPKGTNQVPKILRV